MTTKIATNLNNFTYSEVHPTPPPPYTDRVFNKPKPLKQLPSQNHK